MRSPPRREQTTLLEQQQQADATAGVKSTPDSMRNVPIDASSVKVESDLPNTARIIRVKPSEMPSDGHTNKVEQKVMNTWFRPLTEESTNPKEKKSVFDDLNSVRDVKNVEYGGALPKVDIESSCTVREKNPTSLANYAFLRQTKTTKSAYKYVVAAPESSDLKPNVEESVKSNVKVKVEVPEENFTGGVGGLGGVVFDNSESSADDTHGVSTDQVEISEKKDLDDVRFTVEDPACGESIGERIRKIISEERSKSPRGRNSSHPGFRKHVNTGDHAVSASGDDSNTVGDCSVFEEGNYLIDVSGDGADPCRRDRQLPEPRLDKVPAEIDSKTVALRNEHGCPIFSEGKNDQNEETPKVFGDLLGEAILDDREQEDSQKESAERAQQHDQWRQQEQAQRHVQEH